MRSKAGEPSQMLMICQTAAPFCPMLTTRTGFLSRSGAVLGVADHAQNFVAQSFEFVVLHNLRAERETIAREMFELSC